MVTCLTHGDGIGGRGGWGYSRYTPDMRGQWIKMFRRGEDPNIMYSKLANTL